MTTTKSTTKQAKIKCPHCCLPITVQTKVTETLEHVSQEGVLEGMFKEIDKTFKAIFGKER